MEGILANKIFSSLNRLAFDLNDLNSLASGIFELSMEPMMVLDSLGRVAAINPAFCQMTGYTDAYLQGKNLGFLFAGYDDPDTAVQSFLSELMKDGYWHGQIVSRAVDGHLINLEAKFAGVLNQDSLNQFYFGVCSQLNRINPSEQCSDGINFNPNIDSLTGVLNLGSFMYRLEYAIRMSEKYKLNLSLLLIDIDNFHNLNEQFGYVFGDRLIKKFAIELNKLLDKADTVARIKDDKFLILVNDVKSQKQIELKANQIFGHFQNKGLFGNMLNTLPFTMAIASYPVSGKTASDLIKAAVDIVAKGKDNGGNQIVYDKLLVK